MTARISPGTARELGLPAYVLSRAAGRVTRTEPPAIFTTLGRGRRTFWGWLGFAASVLAPWGPLSRREQELVILRATRPDQHWPDQTWAPRELAMLVGQYDMLATTLSVLRLKPDAPR